MSSLNSPILSSLVKQKLPANKASIGVYPRNAVLQDRHERLLNEFAEIDANGDKQLSFQEVFSFLNKKSSGKYDKELCRELFAKMDKNQDSIVTTDEFLWCYVETENEVKKSIAEVKTAVSDSMKQIEENKKKLDNAKKSETMNQHGIMEGSMLTVYVFEALGLKPKSGGTVNAFVELVCERQIIETNPGAKNPSPRFDEVFTFQIEHAEDPLRVSVKHQGPYGDPKVIGTAEVNLEQLRDQMKHDFYLDIKDLSGKPTGRVHLGLAWVYSRVKYYQDIIWQWENTLNYDKLQLQKLEDRLQNLRSPFGFLMAESDERTINSTRMSKRLSVRIDNVAYGVIGIDVNWEKLGVIATCIYLCLTVFMMFGKSDMINVSGILVVTRWITWTSLLFRSKTSYPLGFLAGFGGRSF